MPALTDLPELVGFFSYSRDDDHDSEGGLTLLRRRIQSELRGQLGRSEKTLRLFQDAEAIPPGTLWEGEISGAIEQSAFFIPIISPRVIQSEHCGVEFRKFLEREKTLGRTDLIFPILYIDVPELHEDHIWRNHPTLSVIGARQYVNWCDFRFELDGPQVRRAIAQFCTKIGATLRRDIAAPRSVSDPVKPPEPLPAPPRPTSPSGPTTAPVRPLPIIEPDPRLPGATPDRRVEQSADVPASQGTSLNPVSTKVQKNDYAETGQVDWNEIRRAERLEWGREGHERDEREAMRIYGDLAERGDKIAQTNLATMYAQGRGAKTDYREAANWYRKAAQQGWAPAQHILGGLYANGRGVERDDAEAVAWYRKAAEQDYHPGLNALGDMYCAGRGVVKSERDAVAWYRKAAELGDSVAQFNLGKMYESGRGVERDEDKAQWWIRKSAVQGYSEALKRFPDALKRSPNVG